MKEHNRPHLFSPSVGSITLLMVFVVLCLMTFALFSLSTAQANCRSSDASAQAVADYYAADCQAQAILAQLRSGARPQQVSEREGHYFYSCPISSSSTLEVEVRLSGDSYTVLRWQAVSAGQE